MPWSPVLTPAYGRLPKKAKDAKRDFIAGKDWVMQPDGRYCSIRDFPPGTLVELRYAVNNSRCTVVRI